MARSEYIYVIEAYPRGGLVAATTVKREIKEAIEDHGLAVSVTVFRGGKPIRYVRPYDLIEWLNS